MRRATLSAVWAVRLSPPQAYHHDLGPDYAAELLALLSHPNAAARAMAARALPGESLVVRLLDV
jgi:hypothetical protein